MSTLFLDDSPGAIPLSLYTRADFASAQLDLDPLARAWAAANGFAAGEGQILAVPDAQGGVARVLMGIGRNDDLYALAGAPGSLPPGEYRIETGLEPEAASRLALGWALGTYGFGRYRTVPEPRARLVWPEGADQARVANEYEAIALVRDLVNTPANALGPAALAQAAREVAVQFGADCAITVGDALIDAKYPAVHAVGKAAAEPPRVVDINWGDARHPEIALVGKGITFDTGGLDLKTGSNMALMKKDMGGAAHALALGRMIMAAGLPVRLRILLSIAENAIGPAANRPSDVIRTRAGLTVEIGDTDAEGRLVLADGLAAAAEHKPEMILDFATLTGAARVALGPDLPALFATDPLAGDILAASEQAEDPVWRLPLWQPYRRNLDSKIADINNVASNAFAGAIHGALFLQAFVPPEIAWAHFDLYAWNATARPGRPGGGEAFAIRGLFRMIAQRYAP